MRTQQTLVKKAGPISEVAGTLLNPFSIPLGLIGGGIYSGVTPTRSDEEQAEADKHSFRNLLIPGVGPANLFKRIGHNIKKEKNENSAKPEHKSNEKTASTATQQAFIEGFVKRAAEYGYSLYEANAILQKTAKLSVRDLEQHMGHLFHDDAVYQDADRGIEEANANSFALRHPILTGLPTLGIWPSTAAHNALEQASANLLRKHKSLRDERHAQSELAHKRKMELMPLELEQLKRDSHERMLQGGSAAAAALLAAHHNNQRRREYEEDWDGSSTTS